MTQSRIRAAIFDLDGTLVQTEKLKALSYAKAAVELCPRQLTETELIEAFKEVVDVSGLVITKIDGTAKGGVVIGVSDQHGIPIRYVGVGESAADRVFWSNAARFYRVEN